MALDTAFLRFLHYSIHRVLLGLWYCFGSYYEGLFFPFPKMMILSVSMVSLKLHKSLLPNDFLYVLLSCISFTFLTSYYVHPWSKLKQILIILNLQSNIDVTTTCSILKVETTLTFWLTLEAINEYLKVLVVNINTGQSDQSCDKYKQWSQNDALWKVTGSSELIKSATLSMSVKRFCQLLYGHIQSLWVNVHTNVGHIYHVPHPCNLLVLTTVKICWGKAGK